MKALGLIILTLVLTVRSAWGQEQTPPVTVTIPSAAAASATVARGMNYHDIVKALGAPIEKRELESKHGDIWIYPERKIFFQEGRVVAWVNTVQSKSDGTGAPTSAGSENQPVVIQPPMSVLEKTALENLLGEIVEDLNPQKEVIKNKTH